VGNVRASHKKTQVYGQDQYSLLNSLHCFAIAEILAVTLTADDGYFEIPC
jgi:hypothetical protein